MKAVANLLAEDFNMQWNMEDEIQPLKFWVCLGNLSLFCQCAGLSADAKAALNWRTKSQTIWWECFRISSDAITGSYKKCEELFKQQITSHCSMKSQTTHFKTDSNATFNGSYSNHDHAFGSDCGESFGRETTSSVQPIPTKFDKWILLLGPRVNIQVLKVWRTRRQRNRKHAENHDLMVQHRLL